MNIWAVLVHAVVDAFASGIVCAQGKEGRSFCLPSFCSCCSFSSCLPCYLVVITGMCVQNNVTLDGFGKCVRGCPAGECGVLMALASVN